MREWWMKRGGTAISGGSDRRWRVDESTARGGGRRDWSRDAAFCVLSTVTASVALLGRSLSAFFFNSALNAADRSVFLFVIGPHRTGFRWTWLAIWPGFHWPIEDRTVPPPTRWNPKETRWPCSRNETSSLLVKSVKLGKKTKTEETH